MSAGAAGVAAGLAVAVPLGAVAVLLISEGMARGWRAGIAGAFGVASVDLVYAAVATAGGAAVAAALSGRETAVRLVAATVLAAMAVRGLLAARASRSALAEASPEAAPEAAPGAALSPAAGSGTGHRAGSSIARSSIAGSSIAGSSIASSTRHAVRSAGAYWRFVAVTAVNPLTALYFVALAAGLGDRLSGAGATIAFVLGVGVGSLTWQLALAAMGAGAGTAIGPRGRRWTAIGGNLIVLVLALTVAIGPAMARS